MPRPLSRTQITSPGSMMTSMRSQYPASASSMELSTISYTRWCRPDDDVEPMYMPGRFLTASSPSSTWIFDASYSCVIFSLISDIFYRLSL